MPTTLCPGSDGAIPFRSAILDGETVHPGPDGCPMFSELLRRRGPFCFYAFDLVWLDGRDLRGLALSERKALLRKLLPPKAHAVRYVEHVASGGDLFPSSAIGTWRGS